MKISTYHGHIQVDLYIFQEKTAIPSQFIEVYDGHYVYMKYNENYKNLTACNLTGLKVC